MSSQPLRILSLDVENVLRVVAVYVKPDGRVLELTGANRQGKSSVIQAIWMALGGAEMIPEDPIHDGADMAKIVVEIGNDDGIKYVVTRKIRAKEGGGHSLSLTVENEDGGKMQNPQQILNTLIGSLSYDPLAFIDMKPKDQFDLLKKFVTGYDFEANEKANKTDFETRTAVNRDAKAKRAQAGGVVVDQDLLQAVRCDEQALVTQLAEAGNRNTEVDRWHDYRSDVQRKVAALDESAATFTRRAAALRKEADELDASAAAETLKATALRKEILPETAAPQKVDTADLQAKIAEARRHNERLDANLRANTLLQALTGEAEVLERKSAELTKAIEARNAAKTEAISKSAMPVPGIDFGDDAIYFDGHPLKNASQAQQLEIAISIAAALQPKLRFITTKSGALLDDNSWAAMVKMAEEKDLLIIAETVKSDRPTAVVIEDGHVRSNKKGS